MKFHQKHVLALLLGVGGIAGLIGVQRIDFCSSQQSVLDTLMLVWGLLTILLFVGVAAAYTAPRFLIFISSIVILGAAGSLFVLVNVSCMAASVWIALGWVLLGIVVLGLLLPDRRSRLALACLSVLFTCMLLEGGTRLYMRLFPVNTVWPVMPDEQLGWRFYPENEWPWSGRDPACVSFHVTMKSNQEGFYDLNHPVEKPADTVRIAMIGDSFTESAQVQFEERSYRLLQKKLNESPPDPNKQYETLNFGISNFSVAQFMLAYDLYAAKYQPDYVFITLFYTQFLRNVPGSGYSISSSSDSLQIRPYYVLNEAGELELIPPDKGDLEVFGDLMQSFKDENGEIRNYVYKPPEREPAGSFWENPYDWLVSYSSFARLMNFRLEAVWYDWYESGGKSEISAAERLTYADYQQGNFFSSSSENDLMMLHFIMLREFAARVRANGGELVIMNYAASPTYEALKYFAQDHHIGYVDLTARMAEALKEGDVNWLCDSHWNAHGNAVAAEAMVDWLEQRLTQPYQLYGSEHLAVYEQPGGVWHFYAIVEGQGIFVAQFDPSQAVDQELLLESAEGWSVIIRPVDGYNQVFLYNAQGEVLDSQYTFYQAGNFKERE
ncbi:MAG: SGNH/GDSL hydrolase family protein [Anaerolineae bacterium]|nr:SGNH/GDSL hydrolase family protein [Anaerolineae bacterium]